MNSNAIFLRAVHSSRGRHRENDRRSGVALATLNVNQGRITVTQRVVAHVEAVLNAYCAR